MLFFTKMKMETYIICVVYTKRICQQMILKRSLVFCQIKFCVFTREIDPMIKEYEIVLFLRSLKNALASDLLLNRIVVTRLDGLIQDPQMYRERMH